MAASTDPRRRRCGRAGSARPSRSGRSRHQGEAHPEAREVAQHQGELPSRHPGEGARREQRQHRHGEPSTAACSRTATFTSRASSSRGTSSTRSRIMLSGRAQDAGEERPVERRRTEVEEAGTARPRRPARPPLPAAAGQRPWWPACPPPCPAPNADERAGCRSCGVLPRGRGRRDGPGRRLTARRRSASDWRPGSRVHRARRRSSPTLKAER